MNEIVTAISSIGFPIVACCGMAWYINNTMKEFTDTMQKNTSALEKLIMLLGKDDSDK